MGESSFAHLHLHSVYSQLDGASKVSEVVAAAKADGQPGIASTEHGNLNGLIDFYKECQKQGIKYVPGQEFYFADDRTEKVKVKESAHSDLDGSDKRYYHLTVLAEDNDGYHNLMKLSSDAFLNGYFYKPRCDWSTLEQFSKGLIATTGCLGGPVLQRLLHNDFDGAVRTAARLQDIFGKDNLFVELQDHGLPEQARTNPLLIDLARKINAPLLATNDTHYTHAHDYEIHDALLCMQTGAKISDTNRFRFKSNQHWLKSAREMRSLFPEFPDACDNTLWVVERSNVEIKFGEPHLPKFTPPDGFADDYAFLEHLTFEGLKERYSGEGLQAAQERAAYELSVIRSMGFSSYFLIFWDLVNFTKREGIFTGPGRGSAASSIVAYSLGITKIDPLQHDLIFERFLNPDRISMPDIDWDIDSRYRDKLINYTREKYGEDHTAQIITFSKIKARSAVRDAARVLGYDYKLGDKIAKMMPPLVMGVSTPLHACFKETPRYEAGYRNAEPLRQLYDSDPDARKVIDVALGVEDGIRQDGIHAAGVVIGDRPLVELIPIQRKYEKGVAQPIVTQYEKDAIEDLGLLKMDFLGLRNLDVISDTLKLAGLPDDFYLNIPLDDMETFYMLQNGHGIGVFQVESPNMRQLLVRLGPNSIDDISALLALYRPGPMAENMHNDYADRKNGRQAAVPFHEDAAPILEKTYQLPIYQEQIMEISRKFAGYSMAEGDNLRKIMGKKLPEKMKEEKAKFVSGCISSGYSEEFAERLFEMIEGFSGYGFNASHSYSYGYITYWTAYLKCHYPREYMASLCTSVMDNFDKTALYLGEARRMGLSIDPPDVNSSGSKYEVSPDGIRIGLSLIRDVGEGLAERIVQERLQNGPYKSLYDFVVRVDPKSDSLQSLALAGALDAFGTRQGIYSVAKDILKQCRKDIKKNSPAQGSLFDNVEMLELDIPDTEFSWHDKLNKEKESLGMYVSGHPLADYDDLEAETTISDLKETEFEDRGRISAQKILALVSNIEVKYTKKGEAMAIVTFEDQTGQLETVCFPQAWSKIHNTIFQNGVVFAWIRPGRDFRDERNYVLSALDVVDARTQTEDNQKIFGVYVPSKFNTNAKYMSKLKGILLSYPGTTPTHVFLTRNSVVELEHRFLVEPCEEMKKDIKSLFEDYNAEMKGL